MKMISRRSVFLLLALAAVAALVTTVGAGANSGKKAASVQVCVLLPDTKSSVRWVQFDAPDFAKALKAAGVTYSITNALNDPQKQKAQAQACLAAGAKVVVETMLDNGSAAGDREALHVEGRQGDRLRPPGHRWHRVRLRHVRRQEGRRAQANGILAALKGKTKPVVAELWGGQTDRTRSGSRAVTTPS